MRCGSDTESALLLLISTEAEEGGRLGRMGGPGSRPSERAGRFLGHDGGENHLVIPGNASNHLHIYKYSAPLAAIFQSALKIFILISGHSLLLTDFHRWHKYHLRRKL